MKSAYDRALERFGNDPVQKLNDAQKAAIAEVERTYTARIAQAELSAKDALAAASNNRDRQREIAERLAAELTSLREKCEREKQKVRNAAD